MRRLNRATMLLGATVTLTACPQDTSVWVAPGSTSDHLEFALGKEQGRQQSISIGVLRVDECAGGDAPLWLIEATSNAPQLSAVTYGVAPQGFRETADAAQLSPGCYQVTISGSGRARFTVDNGRTCGWGSTAVTSATDQPCLLTRRSRRVRLFGFGPLSLT